MVGFVDDDPRKRGQWIGGRPVLGTIDRLPEIARSREIEQLLFAIPRMPAARVREILSACAELKLSYKVLPVSFAYLNDRADVSVLADLQPDHLLARNVVRFDDEELDRLVRGRRILVTGAAGSIGSEACRQIAAHAPGPPRARRHRGEQPLLPVPPPAPPSSAAGCARRRWSTSVTLPRVEQLLRDATGRRTSCTPRRTSTCR